MPHENVNPPSLPEPVGFAHATVAPAGGRTVHLGGQTAMDRDGLIVPGGIVEQFRRAFGNLLTALTAAGGTAADLVAVTIYLTDVDDYQAHGREIGRIWRELAAGPITRRWPVSASRGCGNPRR